MSTSDAGHSDPKFAAAMRDISRAAYADIWHRGRKQEVLSGEDKLFFDAMQAHPEYTDIWERASELANQEVVVDGVNPFLHIALHSIVERQIAEHKPPETGQTLFRLVHAGMDRHTALHQIAQVFSELLGELLRDKKPFDAAKYQRRLRALKP